MKEGGGRLRPPRASGQDDTESYFQRSIKTPQAETWGYTDEAVPARAQEKIDLRQPDLASNT
ncbi:hypothetical protein [Oscillatoria sp. HE19RPO]|uniref:hypothetical protein n=1 Tax=Oscillatoria sp. HE19RPO TaxID=2954806 RepID=UPI0020C43A4B|nr:hypothetical protein [Oscillatoria sp. HE19RPO]